MLNTTPTSRTTLRELVLLTTLAAFVFGPGVLVTVAQGPTDANNYLAAAFKDTPGCLGFEFARTQGGKQLVFVWFENKQAVIAWYYSEAHQGLMKTFTPGVSSGRQPLADVPDNTGPIMVVGAMTQSTRQEFARSRCRCHRSQSSSTRRCPAVCRQEDGSRQRP